MSLHLQRDLDKIKKELLQLGSMVESNINNAILALSDRREELAELVFKEEELVDEKEVYIEEECLKTLALHQPVAVDLRFIVVVLKVNNDLERMGDFAVNIAKRSMFLTKQPPIAIPVGFTDNMLQSIRTMVHNSLEALVTLDVELAQEVIDMDDAVDAMNKQMYVELQALMAGDISTIERAIAVLSTSRYLERIADLATNICEDVIFMVNGSVIRHKKG